jgi:hypothetical protein
MVEKTYQIIGVWAQRFKHQKWIGPKRIGGQLFINHHWLVVLIILKNHGVRQLGLLFPLDGKS